MMLVTLKEGMGADKGSLAKRIMQINFDAIETMEDLSTGGCRIYFRNRNEDVEVEEDTAALLHDGHTDAEVSAMVTTALFIDTTRYVGWTLVALIIIAIELLVLILWGK